jgi:hypothetical protein
MDTGTEAVAETNDTKLNHYKLRIYMKNFQIENIKVKLNGHILEISAFNDDKNNDILQKPYKYKKEYLKRIVLPNHSTIDLKTMKYYFDETDKNYLIIEFLSNITQNYFMDFIDTTTNGEATANGTEHSVDKDKCVSIIDNIAKDLVNLKSLQDIKAAIQKEFHKNNK